MAEKSAAFAMNFDAESTQNLKKVSIKSIGRCFNDTKKNLGSVIALPILCVLQAVTFVEIPKILGNIIDLFLNALFSSVIKNEISVDGQELKKYLIEALILLVSNAVCLCLVGTTAVRISSGLSDTLRNKMFEKIGKVDMSYLDSHSRTEVSEKLTSQIDILNQNLTIILNRNVTAVCMIVAIITTVFRIDIIFGFIMLLSIPLAFVFGKISKAITMLFEKKQKKIYIVPDASELFENMQTIHCSGRADAIKKMLIAGEDEKLRRVKQGRLQDGVSRLPSVALTGLLSALAMIIYVSIFYDNSKAVSVGLLLSILVYIRKIEPSFSDLGSVPQLLSSAANSINEVYDFLSAPDELSGNKPVNFEKSEQLTLAFNNVSFAYKRENGNVISDFNCKIPNNGITVIKGVTGAGKTTVLKLLLGYYRPQVGGIYLNDNRIENYLTDDYRNLFSVITQESSLFDMSIRDNIVYPDVSINQRKLTETMNALKIDEKICSVEPKNLSDGQIQRVLIARAYYHDRRFLIFDESFSHLDYENEAEIFAVLKSLAAEKGIIIISHRDSATEIADRLIEIV